MLTVVRHEARTQCAAIHRAQGSRHCDLRLSVPGNGVIRVDGECGCRDFLVDMITECHRLLVERPERLHNPLGAVRAHMRLRAMPDWIRHRRTAMGAQARVDRIRTGSRARGLPDEFHRALLEYLVDEAGVMAPLDGEDQLMSRLAVRCAAEFGGAPEQYAERVTGGVAVVERCCRAGPRVNAGTTEWPDYVTWWERYIQRPLGRRPRRAVVPIPAAPGAAARVHAAFEPLLAQRHEAETDERVVAVLRESRRRSPEATDPALRNGIAELVAHGLLPERTATALLTDDARFASAAQALSAMD